MARSRRGVGGRFKGNGKTPEFHQFLDLVRQDRFLTDYLIIIIIIIIIIIVVVTRQASIELFRPRLIVSSKVFLVVIVHLVCNSA